ncbi:PREDICTED: intraflagellar transport protein 20 homolog isoform X6 [Miniopterus natalensis]|uniref:intraflagellar transport protein 20 homolog isoform X6 n=1 Tax=Miniopterus natalensis TaxID=291302 RepID=UPI0007A6EAFA|nr:PREDICTED: intraflagellar transport protein 20 homolog isoform X6 [Miniopterus natalensis]
MPVTSNWTLFFLTLAPMTHLLLAATITPSEQICREAGRETAMAKDILGEAGLHFDELNKLRVLDPEVTQQTIELKEECKDFVDKIGQFQKIVGGLIELVDQLAKEAENEKMKAIGARNLLKSIAKQREAQQQQLQALIAEKKMQLERNELKISLFSRRAKNPLCHSSDFD